MFGLGFGEILVLAAIGLIVLGPKQMPQVARVLGKTIGELRKAMREVTSTFTAEIVEDEKPKTPVAKEEEFKPKQFVPTGTLNSTPVAHQSHDDPAVPPKKEES
jgi:sec-independent protein translocase protein TatB